jgi:Fur family ferric uptake transcriptional regulator
MPTTSELEGMLRAADLRVTRPRLAVLAAVHDHPHADTESITGSVARYESRVADNHHHVVCRRCGTIADVDCAVGHAPCLTPSDDHGFRIDEAEVTYWGLCPDCAAAAERTHRHSPTDQ